MMAQTCDQACYFINTSVYSIYYYCRKYSVTENWVSQIQIKYVSSGIYVIFRILSFMLYQILKIESENKTNFTET